MTVDEYVLDRVRRAERYGRWVEISREVAHENSELLAWCRRYCNSELPSGDFRFPAARWDELSRSPLVGLASIPQLNHPDVRMRVLAEYELNRRVAEGVFDHWNAQRQKAVRDTLASGRSLREIARLLGISFGRVRQIRDQDRLA